ncbi:MAG: hypothetical protein BTN85_0875 [Candidatus Methanohalarchaeum thermophilum]|uniref:Methanogenesis marker protein 5 n=1 Tax=Methanohalarchaeum thermophilum TaxID=1903181 RepID=A0A1Q6DVJ6_METT1|nr:MAG: hypothetical protein BTN85_0875 [Candidatus Methanohalarchaeum thermophilum]
MKIFISPPNSLILRDLVKEGGHEPLTMMREIKKKVTKSGLDSPPLNVTELDPEKGLKYASNEVPSGVRGRMAVIGPMIQKADAAIIVKNAKYSFGCVGCARTNELIEYLLNQRDIPLITVEYPESEEEGRKMIKKIRNFLDDLDD